MTPKQVIRAIAADWRQKGYSYQDIAGITGYKYQTIANYIANKKTFFTSAQAVKFKPLGYNLDFLMFGEGALCPEDEPANVLKDDNDFLPEGFKVYCLLSALKSLSDITDDPLIQDVHTHYFQAFTTKDRNECMSSIDEIQRILAKELAKRDKSAKYSAITHYHYLRKEDERPADD